MEIQRSTQLRINRVLKSDIIIIDEIGYTPIERKEANLFFNIISELYEKSSIIITSNKSFSEWSEMMGDDILTTAMLDRLLHHARVFNMDGPSFRTQKRRKYKMFYFVNLFVVFYFVEMIVDNFNICTSNMTNLLENFFVLNRKTYFPSEWDFCFPFTMPRRHFS